MACCLYLVIFLHCLMIFPVTSMENSYSEEPVHLLRALAIVEECGCPDSCLTRIRTCLTSGACSVCKIPTYGKRAAGHRMFFKTPSYK